MKSKFLFLPDKEPMMKFPDDKIKVSPQSLLTKIKGFSNDVGNFKNKCLKNKENLMSILDKYRTNCPLLRDNAVYLPYKDNPDLVIPAQPAKEGSFTGVYDETKILPLLTDMTFLEIIDTSNEIRDEQTLWVKAFWQTENKMVLLKLSEIPLEEFISWDMDESDERDNHFYNKIKDFGLSGIFSELLGSYEYLHESKDRFLNFEHLSVSIFDHNIGLTLEDYLKCNPEIKESEIFQIAIPLIESLIEIQDKGLAIEASHLQSCRLLLKNMREHKETPLNPSKDPAPPSEYKECPFLFTDLSLIKRNSSTSHIMKKSLSVSQAVINIIFKMINNNPNSMNEKSEQTLLSQRLKQIFNQPDLDLVSLLDKLLSLKEEICSIAEITNNKIDYSDLKNKNIVIDESKLYPIYIRFGCYKEAYINAARALTVCENRYGELHLKTLRVKIDLGYLKSLSEKIAQDALSILLQSYQALETLKSKEDELYLLKATCLKYMACIHADINEDNKKALALMEKAGKFSKLNLLTKVELDLIKYDLHLKFASKNDLSLEIGKNIDILDPLTSSSKRAMYLMSECYSLIIRQSTFVENFQAVIDNSEKQVKIKEEMFGPLFCDLPMILNNLGLLYQNYYQDLDTAEILLNNCIQSLILLHGQFHPYLSPCLNNLAAIFSERGHHTKALELIEMSWAMTKLVKSETSNSEKIMYLSNMAMLYQKTGNYPKAINLGEQALTIARNESRDKNTESIAGLLNLLAGIYRETGEKKRALRMCEEGLKIRRFISGSNVNCDLATSINDLALIFKDLNMNQKSLELFESAFEMFKQLFGEVHPHVATALNNLAVLHLQMKNREQSLECFKGALNILRQIYHHEEHPSVASLLHNFALLNFQLGKFNEARGFFEESMAITEKINGRDNIDYLQSGVCLADLLHDIRQFTDADALYSEALQRATDIYHKRHHLVLSIKSKLLRNKRYLKGKNIDSCCTVF